MNTQQQPPEEPWRAFHVYEEQQRQIQAEKQQHLIEEQQRKKQLAEEQHKLREQERRTLEQRLIVQQQRAKQQGTEQQQYKEKERAAFLAQSAEALRRSDQQRHELQRVVTLKRQEQQPAIKGNPMETAFREAWYALCPSIEIIPQYRIGSYRVDFCHPETKTVIELDGHKYHSTRRDRTKDAQRERWIQSQGWHVVRFTGTEVHADLASCIQQALACILQRQGVAGFGAAERGKA